MTDRKELKRLVSFSQPIIATSLQDCGLVCPVLSYLAFSCLYKLVFSSPVLLCHVLSCPFLALGKGDLFPLDKNLPPASLQARSKQNGMCTKMPANTQKNADSLYKSPPSLDGWVCVLCTQTHFHTHRGRPCVVTGDDKWSGRNLSVSNQFGIRLA